MSNEAQGLVRNLLMDAPSKPILLAYANYADEAGYTWPGIETIAFDSGFSVPTVVRVRRELVKNGWILSKRRFGTSAITRINLQKIAVNAFDRGDRTKIKPEFEFEEESAGRELTDHSDLNVHQGSLRTDHSDLNEQITQSCTSDQSDHLSLREPLVDSSVEGRASEILPDYKKKRSTDWAMKLICDLDYGQHRRPSQKRALDLAILVDAAHSKHYLSRAEIKTHCRKALRDAVKSGVSYLHGALQADRLPVPLPKEDKSSPAEDSGAAAIFSDQLDRQALLDKGMSPEHLPKRLKN